MTNQYHPLAKLCFKAVQSRYIFGPTKIEQEQVQDKLNTIIIEWLEGVYKKLFWIDDQTTLRIDSEAFRKELHLPTKPDIESELSKAITKDWDIIVEDQKVFCAADIASKTALKFLREKNLLKENE